MVNMGIKHRQAPYFARMDKPPQASWAFRRRPEQPGVGRRRLRMLEARA
jgi:hypothetical protein